MVQGILLHDDVAGAPWLDAPRHWTEKHLARTPGLQPLLGLAVDKAPAFEIPTRGALLDLYMGDDVVGGWSIPPPLYNLISWS